MLTKEESEKKISELRESIEGIGRADYPFTHKGYELNTMIPCTDFSKWIIERYVEKDFWAIKLLIWEIIKGAKGLMFGGNEDPNLPKEEKIGFQSLCLTINYLLSYNLRNFFDEDDFSIAELFTLLLLSNDLPIAIINKYIYSPDDYQYNIGFNKYIDALGCSSIKPKLEFINNYVLQSENVKQKYYKNRGINYEIVTTYNLQLDYHLIESNNLFNTLKSLPISSRLHFWDLINSSYIEDNIRVNRREKLECWYRTIEFGLNPEDSNKSLLENNLLIPLSDIKITLNLLKRDELFKIAEKFNLEFKKNESKASLVVKILSISDKENVLNEILKEKQIFMFEPSIENDLQRLTEFKKQFSKILEVLFLIEFNKPYRPFTIAKDGKDYYIFYKDDKSTHPLIL